MTTQSFTHAPMSPARAGWLVAVMCGVAGIVAKRNLQPAPGCFPMTD